MQNGTMKPETPSPDDQGRWQSWIYEAQHFQKTIKHQFAQLAKDVCDPEGLPWSDGGTSKRLMMLNSSPKKEGYFF